MVFGVMKKIVDWDEFESRYVPLQNHIEKDAPLSGWMFETYGKEYDYIIQAHNASPDRVWSFIDGANGDVLIVSGLIPFDCIGYVITENPIGSGESVSVIDEDGVVHNVSLRGKWFDIKASFSGSFEAISGQIFDLMVAESAPLLLKSELCVEVFGANSRDGALSFLSKRKELFFAMDIYVEMVDLYFGNEYLMAGITHLAKKHGDELEYLLVRKALERVF